MNVNISARVHTSKPVKLVVSRDNFQTIDYTTDNLTPVLNGNAFVVKAKLPTPLLNTTYQVSVELSNYGGAIIQEFKTPSNVIGLPETFSFGAASCGNSGTNANTYARIRERCESGDMSFFVHTGDLHYDDIAINNPTLFQMAFDRAFSRTLSQGQAWAKMPLLYMWDDHDYGPNDSDMDSPSREASVAAFRARTPFDLASSHPDDGVYYAFTRGRIRFIVTDIRSERSPKGQADDASKQVMSATQKSWFFSELQSAKNNGFFVCWVNTKPWCAATQSNADHWGGYSTARTEISNYITSLNINDQMFIVSGDMHALAYDDGSSINNSGGIKIIQAAPLDRSNSTKGGPYTTGPITNRQTQYGLVDVTDTGGSSISIRFRGYSCSVSTQSEDLVLDESFTLTL